MVFKKPGENRKDNSGRSSRKRTKDDNTMKESSGYSKREFTVNKESKKSYEKKPFAGSKFSKDKKSNSTGKPTEFKGKREGGFGGSFKKSFNNTESEQGRKPFAGKKQWKSFDKEKSVSKRSDESPKSKPVLRGRKKAEPAKNSDLIRLNRYIANAGICSRRKADELIEAGVITVNGMVVSELGHKVNPVTDEVRYNNETLKRQKNVYVLLNKPKDYITTTDDPQERRTVMHLVEKASRERIYPVGRLDRNTTGLLLMTNDGDLADKLSHPRSNITKLYHVELNKSLVQGDLNKIAFGLELEDGLIKPDSISYVAGASKREIGIQIHSGKNRIVRRIFEHLGYEVVKLDRAVYAGLTKKDLPRGRWRYLEEKEIIQLKHLI